MDYEDPVKTIAERLYYKSNTPTINDIASILQQMYRFNSEEALGVAESLEDEVIEQWKIVRQNYLNNINNNLRSIIGVVSNIIYKDDLDISEQNIVNILANDASLRGHPLFKYHFTYQAAQDTARRIIQDVVNKVNQKIEAAQKIAEEQAQIEQSLKIQKVEQELEKRARTNKQEPKDWYIAQLKRSKLLKDFDDEIKEALCNYYKETWYWYNSHEEGEERRRITIKNKIYDYVVTHPDENLRTPESFKQLIRSWESSIPDDEAYTYYKAVYFMIPGASFHVNEPVNPHQPGFKSLHKYKFSKKTPKIRPSITNTFPLKENLKRYRLHKIAPRGTYMIDLMFGSNKLTYLVAININTRYACVELTNIIGNDNEILKTDAKTSTSYLRALRRIMEEVKDNPILHLTGDDECAFGSNDSKKFYEDNGITFHPVPRMKIEGKNGTAPLHSSLGLIDRFIRTIRDMLYQAGYGLTPLAIKEMVRQYNNAPHKTLSKWIGFDVSPLMVQRDKNKEEYIVEKIRKANIATKLNYGYNIPIGTKVKVYNEKNVLGKRRTICKEGTITGKRKGLYEVKINGKDYSVPRFKLSFLH